MHQYRFKCLRYERIGPLESKPIRTKYSLVRKCIQKLWIILFSFCLILKIPQICWLNWCVLSFCSLSNLYGCNYVGHWSTSAFGHFYMNRVKMWIQNKESNRFCEPHWSEWQKNDITQQQKRRWIRGLVSLSIIQYALIKWMLPRMTAH